MGEWRKLQTIYINDENLFNSCSPEQHVSIEINTNVQWLVLTPVKNIRTATYKYTVQILNTAMFKSNADKDNL